MCDSVSIQEFITVAPSLYSATRALPTEYPRLAGAARAVLERPIGYPETGAFLAVESAIVSPHLTDRTPVVWPGASEGTMPLAAVPTFVWARIRVIRGLIFTQLVSVRGASIALDLLLFDTCCVGG